MKDFPTYTFFSPVANTHFDRAINAIAQNDKVALRQCMNSNEILTKTDDNGRTLLHHAVFTADLEIIITVLPTPGTYLRHQKDNFEKTALNLAEASGRVDILERLIPYFYFRKPHTQWPTEKENQYFLNLLETHLLTSTYLSMNDITSPSIDPKFLSLTRKKINSIIKELHYDSDLWDDIFDDDEIFRPVHGADTEANINLYFDKFRDEFKTDRDCENFIKNRIELFRFYMFLRRCVILYRDPTRDPLIRDQCAVLINFVTLQQNNKWFKSKLRVDAFARQGENWTSGLHEWLACSLTQQAIRRAAGIENDVQPCLPECLWAWYDENGQEQTYICSEFNWLDLQFLIRTPTKYMAFSDLQSGHVRSINQYPGFITGPGNPGFLTKGNKGKQGFEAQLETILSDSHTIKDFMEAVHNQYEISIFHDRTTINTTKETYYLVDGTQTNTPSELEFFQKKLTKPHRAIQRWHTDMLIHHYLGNEHKPPNTLTNVYQS